MEEVKNDVVSEQKTVDNSNNYIEAIKEIKSKTVDKEAYDKLAQENKQLLDTLINGETLQQETKEPEVDINELRKTLFSKDCSNLEYIDTALKLRNELIKRGEKDPFLPYGKQILPTEEDKMKAERAAQVMQECVDIADGNSDIFTNELQRRMVDPVLPRRR